MEVLALGLDTDTLTLPPACLSLLPPPPWQAIFIRDNVIEWVGKTADLPLDMSEADRVISGKGHVFMPGRQLGNWLPQLVAPCQQFSKAKSWCPVTMYYGNVAFRANRHGVPLQHLPPAALPPSPAAGMVNTHAHMFQSLNRCMAQVRPRMEVGHVCQLFLCMYVLLFVWMVAFVAVHHLAQLQSAP